MPPGVRFQLVFISPGVGVLNSFCPGSGEFAHQNNCPGVLPGGGGWSGLELTDTLKVYGCTFRILGGGRVEGLRMCHPPYHHP